MTIAILADLDDTRVPDYGGYVEKVNMGADRALVSEIEHALAAAFGRMAVRSSSVWSEIGLAVN